MKQKDLYNNYEEYIKHQSEKNTHKVEIDWHNENWDRVTKLFAERFTQLDHIIGDNKSEKKTLCVGARAGEEVQGLINCGYQSIGIDVNPMEGYEHLVTKEDAHKTSFDDNSFDIIYTNIIDHIFDINKFIKECDRILKDDGHVIFDFCTNGSGFGEFDIISLDSDSELTNHFPSSWSIIENSTNEWTAKHIEKSLMHSVVIQKNENK